MRAAEQMAAPVAPSHLFPFDQTRVSHVVMTHASNMTSLFICSKLESLTAKEMVKMEVPDMGMSTPVQRLYELVSQNLHVDACEFELVGYGRILNPAQTLAYYGIRSSSVVYVFRKRNTENLIRRRDPAAAAEQASAEPMSQSEVHRIVVALRTALVNPEFRKIIDRLSEREHQENLMSVTPGLREDPIAMAILQDFDMLNLCTEHDNISKVIHKHPSLATAATFLAAEFHEQHSSADIFRRSPRSAYSLDEDVDDDEEDEAEAAAYSAAASSTARAGNPNLAQLLREALANANANRPLSDAGASTSRAGQRQVTPSSQPAPANTSN